MGPGNRRTNPDLFDRARPTDIQLLTILNERCQGSPCSRKVKRLDTILDQLDWTALANIVR